MSAMLSDGDALLTQAERDDLTAAMEALVLLRNGDNSRAIADGIEALAKATDFFAERRMDSSIKQALAGHSVDEFEAADDTTLGCEEKAAKAAQQPKP
jgi:molecular chaperone HscA